MENYSRQVDAAFTRDRSRNIFATLHFYLSFKPYHLLDAYFFDLFFSRSIKHLLMFVLFYLLCFNSSVLHPSVVQLCLTKQMMLFFVAASGKMLA